MLRALLSYGGPLGVSQLSRESGLTPQGVRLVLESLENQRALVALGEPRARLYDINPRYPFVGVLRQLVAAETLRWEQVLQAVRNAVREHRTLSAAWYYGSAARGEDEAASDLDLAIVVRGEDLEQTLASIRHALQPAEETLLFTCSVVGLSESDVARLSRDNDAWWTGLVRDAKVLVGMGPGQLARHAKRQPEAA